MSVSLGQTAGQQQIAGEHLVGPDGTVNLGTYGSVYVAGMTMAEAKQAIEEQLKNYLEEPRVSVDIFAYNSKVYYVITEGAGSGDTLVRVPITGNETVLDALAQVNGLSRLSSKNIWIARPTPGGVSCDQMLPVNWDEITKGAATATNYQVLPGDRIFIAENKVIALGHVSRSAHQSVRADLWFRVVERTSYSAFQPLSQGCRPGHRHLAQPPPKVWRERRVANAAATNRKPGD